MIEWNLGVNGITVPELLNAIWEYILDNQQIGLIIKTAIILTVNSEQKGCLFTDILSDLLIFKPNGWEDECLAILIQE